MSFVHIRWSTSRKWIDDWLAHRWLSPLQHATKRFKGIHAPAASPNSSLAHARCDLILPYLVPFHIINIEDNIWYDIYHSKHSYHSSCVWKIAEVDHSPQVDTYCCFRHVVQFGHGYTHARVEGTTPALVVLVQQEWDVVRASFNCCPDMRTRCYWTSRWKLYVVEIDLYPLFLYLHALPNTSHDSFWVEGNVAWIRRDFTWRLLGWYWLFEFFRTKATTRLGRQCAWNPVMTPFNSATAKNKPTKGALKH